MRTSTLKGLFDLCPELKWPYAKASFVGESGSSPETVMLASLVTDRMWEKCMRSLYRKERDFCFIPKNALTNTDMRAHRMLQVSLASKLK